MDGTIVDTEPYWMSAERNLVREHGGTWTAEDAESVIGSDLWTAARVFQRHGVELPEDAIVQQLSDSVLAQITERVPWRPGAQQLLRELYDNQVPCVLVTMSLGPMARYVVDAIDFPAFTAIITGDLVTHGKPHPEPYRMGAARLGLSPRECVAIEDSLTGLASAVASGATSLAVPAHQHIPAGEGYTVWPTLEGRTLADLSTLHAATSTKAS